MEGAGFPLAAWIGGAPEWSLPLFALLGLLAHLGGFGENGLTDLEYDRLDPSKADHPLVSGRVRFGTALAFVYGCQAGGVLVFVLLSGHLGTSAWHPTLLSVGSFLGYIVLGHVYNLYGKSWKPGAVLEISAAFSLAFLAAGSVWTGSATPLVWLVSLYAFAFVAFQIAVAGELKEIERPNERNLLRRLGSRVGAGPLGATSPAWSRVAEQNPGGVTGDTTPFLIPSTGTLALGFGLSAAKAAALGALAWDLAGALWGAVVGVASLCLFGLYTAVLLRPGPFNRGARLRAMGIGEAGSYLLLVVALGPALWPWLVGAFIIIPVLFFGAMNRRLWRRTGSAWAPGV